MKVNQKIKRDLIISEQLRCFVLYEFLHHSLRRNGAVKNMDNFRSFHTWNTGTFLGNRILFTGSDYEFRTFICEFADYFF